MIMFKDSNVFEFTNFSLKSKYNNNYLFSRRKQEEKLMKQFFDKIYRVFIGISSKLDDF